MEAKPLLATGCDHAGYFLKEKIITWLKARGYQIKDVGTYSADSVDYPDFAHAVAAAIEKGEVTQGILICGSANGVAIAANKHRSIRAAIAWKPELASLARKHNDANIICIPARFVTDEEAINILSSFLNADFEGGRHRNRVDKIPINH